MMTFEFVFLDYLSRFVVDILSFVFSSISQQGFTSLDDLRDKAELNFQQKIGLKYYNEINERMPREEVTQLENVVS